MYNPFIENAFEVMYSLFGTYKNYIFIWNFFQGYWKIIEIFYRGIAPKDSNNYFNFLQEFVYPMESYNWICFWGPDFSTLS